MGIKWEQDLQNGKKMGTKWEQSGTRMGTKWGQSGTRTTKWDKNGKSIKIYLLLGLCRLLGQSFAMAAVGSGTGNGT